MRKAGCEMKNILIIDGAENCEYAIFAVTEDEFTKIFPADGQNVEFVEDLVERIGDDGIASLMNPVWKREVKKPNANGIHGTLFYELYSKKKYYPTKNDQQMIT
jgi:hypothetical protein